jgi:hypothetical protein
VAERENSPTGDEEHIEVEIRNPVEPLAKEPGVTVEEPSQERRVRRDLVVGVSSFSPEDRRRQLEESITHWQKAGPRAIWDATSEMTAEWFLLRGIDPTTQRVDRSVVGIRPVPWAENAARDDEDEERGATQR